MIRDPIDAIVAAVGVGLAFAGLFLLLPGVRRAAAAGLQALEEAPEQAAVPAE